MDEILGDGAAAARRMAGETMREVRDADGLPGPGAAAGGGDHELDTPSERMEKIIKAAVERGASDLHIKAGDVFRARINGKLVPLTKQRLTPDQTRAIALKLISSEEDRARIDRLRDFDCSWGMPGRRAVPGQHAAAALVVHDRDAGDPVRGADHRVAPPAGGARSRSPRRSAGWCW